MTRIGSLASIWRYPAKSMMGDSLSNSTIGEAGVLGDRGWAVRDEVRGGIRGAKKIPQLMTLHARYLDEPVAGSPPPHIEITTPDEQRIRSDGPDVDDRLSAALQHRVALQALRPATDLEHYRRGPPDNPDAEAELREMFGREPDEPLPDFDGFPLDVLIEYESPPGTYFDAFPILVVTDRSLATLGSMASASNFDVRRFRPNLVINVDDTITGDLPEQDWLGHRLRVGDVELEVSAACMRCVMTTHAFADLPQ